MRFVVFPQRADFVAGAVVGVEPEVEDDAVEEEFEGEIGADGGEVPGVEMSSYEDEEEGAEDGEEGYCEEGFGEGGGCDWVAGVLVAVEEAHSVGWGSAEVISCFWIHAAYFEPRLSSTAPSLAIM